MKLLTKIFILLLCMGLLCLPVGAEGISSANSTVTVDGDGSCYITLHFQLQLDESKTLTFPLPDGAKNVRLNGSAGKVSAGDQLSVRLGKLGAGTHTVEISFTLSDTITSDGSTLNFEVPLLTGFSLPIENFSFTVTMPNTLTATPTLSSNWAGDVTDKIQLRCSGATIYGSADGTVLDSTELQLQYAGDREMFPDYKESNLPGLWKTLTVLLFIFAGVYYIFALMPSFPKKVRSFSPPEGLGAGDLGTCVTGCGIDLTMTVFTWAQLGYLSIHMDRRQRIILEKRMEMGSERSDFENRAFQKLFSGRQTVDATGLHYALLSRKLRSKSPLLRQIYRSRSGNPMIVRVLAVAAGFTGGVMLSRGVYTSGAFLAVLLGLGLGILCGGLSHVIHDLGRSVPLGNRSPLWQGILCAGAMVILGWLCGNTVTGVLLALGQVAVGLAAAVGGRRSEAGRQYLGEIRGLRAHLTRGSIFDMQNCLEKNPGYFFELMPYALALGVESRFARRFGKVRLAQCDYLTAPDASNLTPAQWATLLRQVAACMDRRQRRLKYEQLLQAGRR